MQQLQVRKAQINVIQSLLNNTKLYAPNEGVVGKRWLMQGDIVQPGQAVFHDCKR